MTARTRVARALCGLLAVPASLGAQGGVPDTVTGVVFDSLAREPLAGAIVVGRPHVAAAIADERGRFELVSDSLVQQLVVHHPSLDLMGLDGIGAARPDPRGPWRDVSLATPSFATIWRAVCEGPMPVEQSGSPTRGVLVGSARLAIARTGADEAALPATGPVLVAGAAVEVAWRSPLDGRTGSRRALTDSMGTWALCDVPVATELALAATSVEAVSGVVRLAADARRVRRIDLLLGRTGDRLGGIVRGRIVDETGFPVAGARDREARLVHDAPTNDAAEAIPGAPEQQVDPAHATRVGREPHDAAHGLDARGRERQFGRDRHVAQRPRAHRVGERPAASRASIERRSPRDLHRRAGDEHGARGRQRGLVGAGPRDGEPRRAHQHAARGRTRLFDRHRPFAHRAPDGRERRRRERHVAPGATRVRTRRTDAVEPHEVERRMVHHELLHERIAHELEAPSLVGDRGGHVRTPDHDGTRERFTGEGIEDDAGDGVGHAPLGAQRRGHGEQAAECAGDARPRGHGRSPYFVQKSTTAQLSPSGW